MDPRIDPEAPLCIGCGGEGRFDCEDCEGSGDDPTGDGNCDTCTGVGHDDCEDCDGTGRAAANPEGPTQP